MKEIFGGLAAVALMIGCCLLPLVLIGAGSAGIAGILAWFGGLNPILVLAVLGSGGFLAYHAVRRARGSAGRREGLPGDAPTAMVRKEGGRIPVTRRHLPE
jgi:hypothetical protein